MTAAADRARHAQRSRPPYLAIYSYNYAPEPIGIPFYNTGMATWFARRLGWRVTMHTGLPHYPWWKVPEEFARRDYRWGRGDEIRDGVTVERVRHYVPSAPLTGTKRMRLDASWLWWTFWRSLRARRRPDLVMIIAPPFLGGLLGLFQGWRWRVPVIYHVQDLQIDAAIELGMLPRRIAGLLGWLERFMLARVDLITAVSLGMARRLREKGPTRRPVALFRNWADVEAVDPGRGANRFRAAWELRSDDVVIAYSGNLGRKQGVEVLLHAFAQLVDRPRCQLVIAGEGAERSELEALAARLGLARLRFLPLAPREALGEFLSAADIHCIPQRRAAADLVMPSKLPNIMAVARPLVVTAMPGTELAEVVQAAGCGLVVEPEDPGKLAQALRALVDDAALRTHRGEAGRAYAVRHFTADGILLRFAARAKRLLFRRR
jgi:colanic acid biosynthesis glycosyl transferase WcaI